MQYGGWGCEEAQITKSLRWAVIKGLKLVSVLCRTIPPFSIEDRFSHLFVHQFFLNFFIYAKAALLPDWVLASLPIVCWGIIWNIGSSNSLLFFVVILIVYSVLHRNLKKNRRKNGKHLYQHQGTQRQINSMIWNHYNPNFKKLLCCW